jgi:hypothetical protein
MGHPQTLAQNVDQAYYQIVITRYTKRHDSR